MMQIFDFFDSATIREYNRSNNTEFTPIEKAVIIALSSYTSVEEKLNAWNNILDTVPTSEHSDRELIEDMIRDYESALSLRDKSDGLVFGASLTERDFSDRHRFSYFSSYKKAALSNLEDKQHYLDNDSLRDNETEAVISIRRLDSTDGTDSYDMYFDSEMRLVKIKSNADKKKPTLDSLFVYVPTPFEKGSFVKVNDHGRIRIGMVDETPTREFFHNAVGRNDMRVPVSFSKDKGIIMSNIEELDILSLELCPDEELPEKYNALLWLKNAMYPEKSLSKNRDEDRYIL